MTDFAKRVTSIDISGIRKMFEAAGPNAINMGLGQPDFDTPENIKAAAVRAITEGKTGYTNNAGIDELRAAVADKLKRENGLEYTPKQVLITAGGSGALQSSQEECLHRSHSDRTCIWMWKHSRKHSPTKRPKSWS